jgi:hypothetical protein
VVGIPALYGTLIVENGCSEDLPRFPSPDSACWIRRIMFLRQTRRKKDGKTHTYWSAVVNQRLAGGRVVQHLVLYLGEIGPSQATAWRKSIEVFDEDAGQARRLALFPEDHASALASDHSVVQLRLSEMRLCRPRQLARMLAGRAVVGRVAARPVLVRPPAAKQQGHTVGSGLAKAGVVPVHCAGRRVETAPRLVRPQCHGRPSGADFRLAGGDSPPFSKGYFRPSGAS